VSAAVGPFSAFELTMTKARWAFSLWARAHPCTWISWRRIRWLQRL